ncbi:DUF4126 family protein [Pseudonocardia sp. GCM10023141]|uniref:DUF4126 family protein n=1 Tax=Pseudonocardia sp. GCM10023141 TaxID=3252653 RepID=UPI0036115C8D
MTTIWRALARGIAAGTAGTGARLAAGLLDPARRDRATARPPALRRLAVSAATDAAIGATAGALRSAGVRLPAAAGGALLGIAGLIATAGPGTVGRMLNPRRWGEVDWAAVAVPQLAYGVTTHQTLLVVSRVAEGRETVLAAPSGTLLRAAALGAASGSRSSAAITAVALTSARNDRGLIAPRLGSPAATVALGLLAIAEAIGDKRPGTPSRLETVPLLARAAAGAVSAGVMARRDDDDPALPAVIGMSTATLAAIAGAGLRGVAARRLRTDKPGAFAEDLLAGLLAWYGARR